MKKQFVDVLVSGSRPREQEADRRNDSPSAKKLRSTPRIVMALYFS